MPRSARIDLARAWAKALTTTAYAPRWRRDIEHMLHDLLDGLFETMTAATFSPGPAREIGVRLIAEHFTSEESLSQTVRVLGQALLSIPELRGLPDLTGRVLAVLGAIAAGHSAQLRVRTLDQQEQVKKALLRARKDAERHLRVSEARFRELFTSSAVGIVITELDGTVVDTNQALREIIGHSESELVERSIYDLLHPADVDGLRQAHQELLNGERVRFRLPQRLRLIDAEGEPLWTYLAVSLLHDADNKPVQQVTIVEDVTELHLLGEQLRDQSLHDALTGLPNQQFFVARMERALAGAIPITVLILNLDGLAVVNDGFGRPVGDRLLRMVAHRLQAVVARERSMVARLCADTFAILIENSPMTPDSATLVSEVNTELAEPAYIDGHGLAVSCSIGIAKSQDITSRDPVELIRAAETAMHQAKRGSRRQWELFDPPRDAQHRSRCRLAAAMSGAWETGEIILRYQPWARLSNNAVVAVEALLRWNHPEHPEPVPHHECVELASRTGLHSRSCSGCCTRAASSSRTGRGSRRRCSTSALPPSTRTIRTCCTPSGVRWTAPGWHRTSSSSVSRSRPCWPNTAKPPRTCNCWPRPACRWRCWTAAAPTRWRWSRISRCPRCPWRARWSGGWPPGATAPRSPPPSPR